MRLKSISLHGFKSFNSRTEIPLSEGITAIVGPNGCGKSNVSDAIRWVLGEGNIRNIRGESILDVIFKGAGSTKPSGFAEVNLLIDNEDHVLSLENDEVSVARRVYRSGDSDFLINNLPCRLKDIRNLFLGTGLGSQGYSVIEREMVDAVLSDRDDRRRLFFEEAAGISRYKIQRKEATRKLDATEQDLLRIDDLVREIEREVRRLARQVGKARKHQRLHDQIRDLEVELALRQWADLELRRAACASERDVGSGAQEKLEGDLVRMEAELETCKLHLTERERLLDGSRDRREALVNEQSTAREEVSVLTTQIRGWERQEQELARRISEETERAESLRERIKDTEPEAAKISEDLDRRRAQVETSERDFSVAEGGLREAREAVAETAQIQMEHLVARTKEGKELEAVSAQITQIEARNVGVTAHRERLVENADELGSRVEKHESELKTLSRRLEEIGRTLLETTGSREGAQEERETLRQKREELARTRASLESRLDLLREQKTRREGFDEAVRSLLGRTDSVAGVRGVVGEMITAVPNLPSSTAEALLADAVQWVVVGDEAAAFAALDFLRATGLGGVTFFPLRENAERFAARPDHWGSEVPLSGEPDLDPLINYLLSSVRLCDSREEAVAAAHASVDQSLRYLSPDGEMIASEGWVRTPGRKGGDQEIIERMREIPRLEDSCSRLEAEERSTIERLSECEAEIARSLELISSFEQQRDELSERHRRFERELTEVRVERGLVSEEIARIAEELRENEQQIAEHKRRHDELERRLGVTGETEREADKRHQLAKVTEAEAEVRRDGALELLSGHRTEAVRLENMLQEIENAKARDREEVERLETALKQWAEEQHGAAQSRESAMSNRTGLERRVGEITEQLEEVARELDRRRSERDEKQTELAVHEQQVRERRSELNDLKERLHSDQVRELEIRSEMDRLSERVQQEFQVDLAEEARLHEEERAAKPEDEREEEPEFDEDKQRLQIAELRQTLLKLGPVNFLAADEYAQQKERLLFHRQQQKDLMKARQDLLDAIAQINETAGRMFKETFDLARVKFQEVFQSLFPGGEADLALIGDDPLEGSIEIKARPRSKKLEAIRLLSTGERSLTAIALLFGIYLVKPSPFCILDELDAPLDDANIDRFIMLLRHFSEGTQFVVITHNKRTMEAADRLYGVTMQEAGISKIVSVQLSDADWEMSPEAAEILQGSGEEGRDG